MIYINIYVYIHYIYIFEAGFDVAHAGLKIIVAEKDFESLILLLLTSVRITVAHQSALLRRCCKLNPELPVRGSILPT